MAGPWFRKRRSLGWGLSPASWQGWLLTLVYAAVLIVAGTTVAASQPLIFLTLVIAHTAVFILVAYLTSGG
jgi:hypothetical protein